MNYQIVKKFALELRPIELNVIMNNVFFESYFIFVLLFLGNIFVL